jgi:fluoride exporter
VTAFAGWTAIGLLAALGALARFAFGGAIQRRVPTEFPLGTLAINTSGAFALGVLAGAGASGWTLRLAGAALLGSYTTFSAWFYESGALVEDGYAPLGALNIVVSVLLGLAAVAAGWGLGGAL